MARNAQFRNTANKFTGDSATNTESCTDLNISRNSQDQSLSDANNPRNVKFVDLIPNRQVFEVLNESVESRRNYYVHVLAILILVVSAGFMMFKTNTIEMFYNVPNSEVSAETAETYSIQLQASIKRLHILNMKIYQMNKKLEGLNTALNQMVKWRDEIKNGTGCQNKSIELSEKVRLQIEQALSLYDADKMGMSDYALESAGGFITSTPGTIPFPSQSNYDIFGIINIQYDSNPRALIQPGIHPGQCFAFYGQTGRIRIKLAQAIKITAVTVEHTYPSLVSDINSAPKDFKVYGLQTSASEEFEELGSFEYSLKQKPLQTFWIDEGKRKRYSHVELKVISNHGHTNYTCIYRFRVHGCLG